MEAPSAIDAALQLSRMPTLAAVMRRQELPDDTLLLIKIAAGCEESGVAAAQRAEIPLRVVQHAAKSYLLQILFAPGSSPSRVLGVNPGASMATIREHMKWLLIWLHPDHNSNEWEAAFAERVLVAWKDVRDPKRTASIVVSNRPPQPAAGRRTNRPVRSRAHLRWIALPLPNAETRRRRRRRIALAALGVGVVIAVSSASVLMRPDMADMIRSFVAAEVAPEAEASSAPGQFQE